MDHGSIAEGYRLAGRYTIQRELGRGGMATVFLAEDTRHGRQIAIKVMRDELSQTVGAERFLREIAIAARLQHPHILPLFDSGEQDGILYYVMPYIAGESLRDRMRRPQAITVAEATNIAREIAGALSYAHERGVVHRDVKPENVLLSKGIAIVADFGIARAATEIAGSAVTSAGMILGTPMYMSPEQCDGDAVIDGRSDTYALGCMLYEMLAGTPPYDGANPVAILARKLTTDPLPLRQLRPQVPAHIEHAISIAMSRAPIDRFRNCEEFAAALTLEGGVDAAGPRGAALAPSPGRPAGARVSSPNLGPLVSRMCNRWRQVNSFDAAFRESQQRSPGRPQVHIVHGPEEESHDSLVERLVATRLNDFATEIVGEERGTVRALRIPWPDGDDFETRCRDLAISLFREIASGYMGADLTALALSQQPGVALSPIVAIHHDIRSSTWDRVTAELLRWYVNDFWGALLPGAQAPLFVVFLKVIYETDKPGFRFGPWRRQRMNSRQDVMASMQTLLQAPSTRCAVHFANELTPVSENDVKDWFSQHALYGSEQARKELAASIFRNAQTRPMAAVEAALEDIHRRFVLQHVNERGGRA